MNFVKTVMTEVAVLPVMGCCRHILLTLPPLSCWPIPTRFIMLFRVALLVSHCLRYFASRTCGAAC